jgi:phage shock protein C
MANKKHYKRSWEDYDVDYNYSSGGTHKKLRRNKIDGILGGVCAGIGDYIGLDHTIVRVICVISVLLGVGSTVVIYGLLWIFVPKDVRAPYRREYRQAKRAYREAPDSPVRTTTFKDVKSKYRSLETRMQDLEQSITSKEWKLRRDFRDLES